MQSLVTSLMLLIAAFLLGPLPADAGCGCEKPPPPPAQVRPRVTYPGGHVTIFGPEIQVGTSYRVRFRSNIAKIDMDVTATAVLARDLANGVFTPQLVVPVPALPPGPTQIKVGTTKLSMTISDGDFTVAPAPVAISDAIGPGTVGSMHAAVSRSGVVYLSLDLTGVHLPRVFEVQLRGYPLMFTSKDVMFYNRQGFLMQTLGDDMPGLFTIAKPANSADSDTLKYSRHEFNTYFLQHVERQPHAIDPTDPNWHLDGTRHIDHNHLIVAITGALRSGGTPSPGSTPAFNLSLNTYTLFHDGLVGDGAVTIGGSASTDSYDSATGMGGSRGDVRSNATVSVADQSVVDGNAMGGAVAISGNGVVTGQVSTTEQTLAFIPVQVPSNVPDIGSITVADGAIHTLARGSYRARDLIVEPGGTLSIDNAEGPVTLYVDGLVVVGGAVQTADQNPENFALYAAGGHPIVLNNDANYHGVVYAPGSLLDLSGLGQFHGAFVGQSVHASADAAVHYDTNLRGSYDTPLFVDPVIDAVPIEPIYDSAPATM